MLFGLLEWVLSRGVLHWSLKSARRSAMSVANSHILYGTTWKFCQVPGAFFWNKLMSSYGASVYGLECR